MMSKIDTTNWPASLQYAPIATAPYNRLSVFQRMIEALKKNTLAQESVLFLFCDAPGRLQDVNCVQKIREYAKTITGFRAVITVAREQNYGGVMNLKDGIGHLFKHYGCCIYLEDDIITSPHFLKYMNDCLVRYKDDPRISAISAYRPSFALETKDVFFLHHMNPWGGAYWSTWYQQVTKRSASEILQELDSRRLKKSFMRYSTAIVSDVRMLKMTEKGVMNAADVVQSANIFLNGTFCVFPPRSLSNHEGFGDGVHCTVPTNDFTSVLSDTPIEVNDLPIEEDPAIVASYHAWILKTHLKLLIRYFGYGIFLKNIWKKLKTTILRQERCHE